LSTGNKLFSFCPRVCVCVRVRVRVRVRVCVRVCVCVCVRVCDVVDWPCGSSPCQHGGTCFLDTDNNNYTCTCPPTHSGDLCETGILPLHTVQLILLFCTVSTHTHVSAAARLMYSLHQALRVQNRIPVQMHPWMLVETTRVTEFEYYFACTRKPLRFTFLTL